ncbi:uncharacterized protein LOC133191693 [Saccostrea echinata]|uniref:uncharacterized protein LOC133182372 n=1 Tax=Saccostrea echinata TaxID=191078 RepID=UPI002A8262E7|nr:uncharacterized protein LOC133182372 [Saccostrea echinata]XP_061183413.1 uncharacterized protein LOC133191693 [Saccostrea echinata]
MSSEFIPGVEAGADVNGELASDLDNVHRLSALEDSSYCDKNVSRTEILDFGDQGFLLHKLMTPSECQHVIEDGEKIGFGEIKGAKRDYRSCDRLVIESEEMALILWRRIQPYLTDFEVAEDSSLKDLHIHGVPYLLRGKWQPVGLNKLFRLCRYYPGGHFAPHFDGYYTKSPEERSLKTFMIYLNGDFNGGSTNFVDEAQTLHKDKNGKYCAEKENVLCKITPEEGMAILFNHQRLHEGEQLLSGKKYILRTDIMYKKMGERQLDAKQEKAIALLQEAERLEAQGDCMQAADLYRKAFKLSPELENCY